MSDFSANIQQFQQNGTYNYEFDDMGNLYFNTSSSDFSQVYLSLPITNIEYDEVSIKNFYTTDFQEFLPTLVSTEVTSSTSDLTDQVSTLQAQNIQLQQQLNNAISGSMTNSSTANSTAVQQVILELRIALGQGSVESDFSSTFPYTPITQPGTRT